MFFVDICSNLSLSQHIQEDTHRSSHSLDPVLSNDVIIAYLRVYPLIHSDYYYYVTFNLFSRPIFIAWGRDTRSIP